MMLSIMAIQEMYYRKDKPLLYFPYLAGKTKKWYCGDDKENYTNQNKPDWHYHNTQDTLYYKFNNQGYRTKELDTLDDYILVFGCSYTEGVGLFENEIWCNLLGKELGIDILNLAKAGTGPDIINLNTQLFVKNKFLKPRAVINQWPQATRKSFAYIERNALLKKQLRLEDRNIMIDSELYNPNDSYLFKDTEWYFKRWIMEEGQLEYENSLHINSVTNLWNALGVPVFNWTFSGDFETVFNNKMVSVITNKANDRARDNAHDGPLIHKEVVDQLLPKIKKII